MSRKKMKKSKKIKILSSVVKYVALSMALVGVIAGAIMASFVFPIVGVLLMIGGIAASVVLEDKAEQQATKEIKPKHPAYKVEEFEADKQEEKSVELVVMDEPQNFSEKETETQASEETFIIGE